MYINNSIQSVYPLISKTVTNKFSHYYQKDFFNAKVRIKYDSDFCNSQANKSLKNNSQIKIHGVSKKYSQEM